MVNAISPDFLRRANKHDTAMSKQTHTEPADFNYDQHSLPRAVKTNAGSQTSRSDEGLLTTQRNASKPARNE